MYQLWVCVFWATCLLSRIVTFKFSILGSGDENKLLKEKERYQVTITTYFLLPFNRP